MRKEQLNLRAYRQCPADDIIKSARMNATWVFSPVFDAQITGNYRAPVKTEGGSQLASASLNASARYKMWGDKSNISLRISDPFKLQKFGYRTANGTVIESSSRYFSARAVYLTISRNFGQSLRIKPKSDPEVPQQGPPSG